MSHVLINYLYLPGTAAVLYERHNNDGGGEMRVERWRGGSNRIGNGNGTVTNQPTNGWRGSINSGRCLPCYSSVARRRE